MPLFHFYLVEGDERDHVGSLDLPHRGEAIPAGLLLTLKILANTACIYSAEDGLLIQATDQFAALVYSFEVRRQVQRRNAEDGYLH